MIYLKDLKFIKMPDYVLLFSVSTYINKYKQYKLTEKKKISYSSLKMYQLTKILLKYEQHIFANL